MIRFGCFTLLALLFVFALAGCAARQISRDAVWVKVVGTETYYFVKTQGISRDRETARENAKHAAKRELAGRYSSDRLDRGKVGATPPLPATKIVEETARQDGKFWIVDITVRVQIPEDAQ